MTKGKEVPFIPNQHKSKPEHDNFPPEIMEQFDSTQVYYVKGIQMRMGQNGQSGFHLTHNVCASYDEALALVPALLRFVILPIGAAEKSESDYRTEFEAKQKEQQEKNDLLEYARLKLKYESIQ